MEKIIYILEVSVSDLVSIVSLICVIVGGIFALYQWRTSVLLKRAEYINELTEKIRTDENIKHMIYLLDYGDEWYSTEFHNGPDEAMVDKTLSYFSYICYLKDRKIISKKEFAFFKYEIHRILMNKQVKDYFYNLYHFSKQYNVTFTFAYLFKYGEKNRFFEEDFYDKTAFIRNEDYHRYLNF